MITELVVHDLGVFASARVELGAGLNALTGETGAGKSLIVGAIQLLLGARADSGVVRPGATEATIDGRFEVDGEEWVLSRTVPLDGRSRAYINGRPVTVGELAETGSRLVELHGQHAHQQLLRPDAQRRALDRFGSIDLEPLTVARAAVRRIDDELATLGGDERTRAREIDLLRYQLDELEAAGLSEPDEDDALDREEDELAGAVAHREAAARAADLLGADDGALDRLHAAVAALAGRGPFAEIEPRLRSVVAEVQELGHEVRDVEDTIAEDPERLAAIRVRRQLLADLRRKYGDSLAEVLAERDRIHERLVELESHDVRVAELGAERARAVAEVEAAAAVVAEQRRLVAPKLAEGVERTLRRLAMPDARVAVTVEGEPPGDDVTFRLAANPGAEPAPMAKVASGGELSRSTLAVRLELSAGPPTLVFDEVDAGIGGEAALAVAEALSDLAARHQILVVTHLPQVAAFAEHHQVVRKVAGADETHAAVRVVAEDGRVDELARMLDGRPESAAGRTHAADLLHSAAARRGSRPQP